MSFWQRIASWFSAPFRRKQKEQEWANRFNQPPANPKNPLPLDPGNDPWRT